MTSAASRSATASPWGALSALCIGFFMILLDTTIVAIAIPVLITGLHTTLNAVVWVTSVYLLAYAVPMLCTSRLGDRFGPKRVFLTGLVLFTVASLGCGLSGNVGTLVAARAVQGIGAALMTPQTLAFVSHLFPPARRGPAMGLWGTVAALASVAGPLLGGLLVDKLGWQWIFFVNVPLGVVALVMTLLLVPDWQPRNAHSFDVTGILLSGAGLLLIVFGLQNGAQYDWGEVWGGFSVTAIIAIGVALLLAFVLWQRSPREPLLPLMVFDNRNFSSGAVTAVTIGFVSTGMSFPLVIYLQEVLGLSPLDSSLLIMPMAILSAVVAPFTGRLSDRISPKYLLIIGMVGLVGALAWIALQITPTTNPWTLTPALSLAGAGIGCIFSPLNNAAMGSVQPKLVGPSSGVFNTARTLGSVFGSAAVSVLLQTRIAADIQSAAAALPLQVQQTLASSGGSTAGLASLPAQLRDAATRAVDTALTSAARQTLWLPVGILVVGVAAAMFMTTKPRPVPATAPAVTDAELVVDHAGDSAALVTMPMPRITDAPAGATKVRVPVSRTSMSAVPSISGALADYHTALRRLTTVGNRFAFAWFASATADSVTIHGVVRRDDANPVSHAMVNLIDLVGAQIDRCVTRADGEYRLTVPTTSNYVLIVSARGFKARALTLFVDVNPIDLDVVLIGSGVIVGHVQLAAGRPAPVNTQVTLVDLQGRVVSTGFTDADGDFGFFGLTPGDYMVTVAVESFKSELRMVHVTDNERSRVDILVASGPLRAQPRKAV